MSPFDLRGPEFLLFYFVLGAIVLAALVASRRFAEPSGTIKADLSDPYLIACLRGGKNELLRVATISLIHRGLLKVTGSSVEVSSSRGADSVRNPLERELLLHFKGLKEASSVFSELVFTFSSQEYEHSLETLGLLPNQWVRANRLRSLGLALLVLWGVALIKIMVAISRGHSNIGFLVLLAGIFGFVAFRLARPRLTLRGKAMLEDLRFLFGGLRSRSSATFTSNDVTLLAAVFGASAIPLMVFPHTRTLYPKAVAAGQGGSSSSCGATVSCGSSGSGGDGGGGCGGGGGGCGGCGS